MRRAYGFQSITQHEHGLICWCHPAFAVCSCGSWNCSGGTVIHWGSQKLAQHVHQPILSMPSQLGV